MKLINIPFLIITASLILGIIAGYYIEIIRPISFILLFISTLGLGISWFRAKKVFRSSAPFSILSVITFMSIGITLVHINDPLHRETHYINFLNSSQTDKSEHGSIQFFVTERLKPTKFYDKYIISARIIEETKTSGKVL